MIRPKRAIRGALAPPVNRLRARMRRRRAARSAPVPDAEIESIEESLVWIFGSPRTGSTWLLRLLGTHPEVVAIDESYVPFHLVPPGLVVPGGGEYLATGARASDPNYFFAREYLPELIPQLRSLVLGQLRRQASHIGGDPSPLRLVIKEPNGSHAADTVFSLLPGARLLFLVRDGRDVVDSLADAMLSEESWWAEEHAAKQGASNVPTIRLEFVRRTGEQWVRRIEVTRRAYDALPDDRRMLVRYEDLRGDTVRTLGSIYAWLGLEIGDRELGAIVDRHQFEAASRGRRGAGKAMRHATPGLWRRSLSGEEQAALSEIMGPSLRDLGYET